MSDSITYHREPTNQKKRATDDHDDTVRKSPRKHDSNSKESNSSLGCPEDSQWDCGTDRTLGQLPRVGVLGMSRGLPMGLWDRQDTGTTPKGGSPWDVLGTISPFSGIWDSPIGNGKAVGHE